MQAQAQTEKVQETVATSQLSTVLDSINTLSACAWVINKPVSVLALFRDGNIHSSGLF